MRPIHLALALLLGAAGCREGMAPAGGGLGLPAPRQLLVQLTVEPTTATGEYVVRGLARPGEGVDAPAAFRATLALPAGVTLVAPAATGGGMLLAVNVVGAAVRIAGAAPDAPASGELFALRLAASSIDALDGATLTLEDVASARGADLRPVLRVATRPARVRAGGGSVP